MVITQEERIKDELRMVAESGYSVNLKTGKWEARIDNIPFPNGWIPDNGSMLFDYPSRYPETHPTVFLPEKYTYKGQPWKPLALQIGGSDRKRWEKVCLLRLREEWNTGYSTITLIDTIQKAMKKPDNPNWFDRI